MQAQAPAPLSQFQTAPVSKWSRYLSTGKPEDARILPVPAFLVLREAAPRRAAPRRMPRHLGVHWPEVWTDAEGRRNLVKFVGQRLRHK